MTVSITDGTYTITPTGELGLAHLHCRELIADCEEWQAIVANPTGRIDEIDQAVIDGGLSRANALARVYLEYLPNELANTNAVPTTPSCIVRCVTGEEIYDRYGPQSFDIIGGFDVEFWWQVPDEWKSEPNMACVDTSEKLQRIINYITNPTTQSERLFVQTIGLPSMGMLNPNETNNELIRCSAITLTYMSA